MLSYEALSNTGNLWEPEQIQANDPVRCRVFETAFPFHPSIHSNGGPGRLNLRRVERPDTMLPSHVIAF